MTNRSQAESDTFVQKWVLAILGIVIALFLFPPLGLVLGFIAGLSAIRSFLRRKREVKVERHLQVVREWRADPQNQQTMPGNGDNGGLSIEERNAYRKSANNHRR